MSRPPAWTRSCARSVLDLIREAADAGAAVLLSSHDLSEVSAICGRAAILREGRLVEMAPISQIVQQGEHRLKVWFTDAALLPDVPLAQLPGVRIVEQEPGVLHVAYQGTADAILKWLSRFPVDRVTTPQTSCRRPSSSTISSLRFPGRAGDSKGGRS